jgi:hypothetical protein
MMYTAENRNVLKLKDVLLNSQIQPFCTTFVLTPLHQIESEKQ